MKRNLAGKFPFYITTLYNTTLYNFQHFDHDLKIKPLSEVFLKKISTLKIGHYSKTFMNKRIKSRIILPIVVIMISFSAYGQFSSRRTNNRFLDNVRFGGGLSLSFGDNFFSASVSPSAIYDFNRYFSAGTGLDFSYFSVNDNKFFVYGASLIGLFNPIRQLQLSAEFQELRVNRTFERDGVNLKDNYWYPSLFLGIGYSNGNVTVGIRYDVLYDDDKSIYGQAYVPFVRLYF